MWERNKFSHTCFNLINSSCVSHTLCRYRRQCTYGCLCVFVYIRVVSWSRRRGRRRSTVWTRRPGNGQPESPENIRTSYIIREYDGYTQTLIFLTHIQIYTISNQVVWLCVSFSVSGGVWEPWFAPHRAGQARPGDEDWRHQRKHAQSWGLSTFIFDHNAVWQRLNNRIYSLSTVSMKSGCSPCLG